MEEAKQRQLKVKNQKTRQIKRGTRGQGLSTRVRKKEIKKRDSAGKEKDKVWRVKKKPC